MKLFVIGVDETTQAFLRGRSFSVTTGDDDVETPEDLYEWIQFGVYDAIVIDLDKKNWGIFAVRYLRSKEIQTAVIGITTGTKEDSWSDQRSAFLENGGDDLFRGPVNPRELAASLRASVRRGNGLTLDIREFRNGDALVRINMSTQVVMVNGIQIHLTGKERILFMLLAGTGERVQTKEMLLSGLYTEIEDEAEIKIIDVFICKLRNKLKQVHPDAAALVETVWGRGYKLADKSLTDNAA